MPPAFVRTIAALLVITMLAVPGPALAKPTGTYEQSPVGPPGPGDSATPVEVVAQADRVDFQDAQGNEMSMFVPGLLSSRKSTALDQFGSADGAAVAEGVTRYAGTAHYDVLITRHASGFDAVIEMANEHAPHRYEFDFDLPMGWSLALNDQGAVSIDDDRGAPQAAVASHGLLTPAAMPCRPTLSWTAMCSCRSWITRERRILCLPIPA